MTTDGMTGEQLAFALATKLPSLRTKCRGVCEGTGKWSFSQPPYEKPCTSCAGRGWVPDVTLEALLVAMEPRYHWFQLIPHTDDFNERFYLASFDNRVTGSIGSWTGATPLEAACRAAYAALTAQEATR